MFETDEKDIRILNEVGPEEPWHLIAKWLAEDWGSSEEIVERVFRLLELDLLTVVPSKGTSIDPTPTSLLRDALSHNWYVATDWPDGPTWQLRVTERGFAVLQASGKSEWR